MSFNKSFFPFLLFGMLLQSCGSDVPVSEGDTKPDVEVATKPANRELAAAKVDAVINTATPSELEAAAEKKREARAEAAAEKKSAVDEARAEKEKARKEKAVKAKADREKRAKEARRKKRREKRKAAKLAAEKAAANKASKVKSVPVDYNNEASSTKKYADGSPVLTFYNKVHNYGTIDQGDKVEHKFKFKNTGKSELVVKDVTATCGCTKPSYPFIPIEPGGEGYIGVLFDSKGKLGRQKPAVTVITNADPASYTIYLEGYVDSGDDETEKKGEKNEEEEKSN